MYGSEFDRGSATKAVPDLVGAMNKPKVVHSQRQRTNNRTEAIGANKNWYKQVTDKNLEQMDVKTNHLGFYDGKDVVKCRNLQTADKRGGGGKQTKTNRLLLLCIHREFFG